MSSEKLGLIGGVGDGRRGGKAGRAGRKPERLARLDVLASWGAALRSRAAGSQDELRCSSTHKQRPYRVLVSAIGLTRARRAVPLVSQMLRAGGTPALRGQLQRQRRPPKKKQAAATNSTAEPRRRLPGLALGDRALRKC